MNVEISKHEELRALEKALFFLKFQQFDNDPNCQLLVGSPLISDIHRRILEVLEVQYKEKGHMRPEESIIGTELGERETDILKKYIHNSIREFPNAKKENRIKSIQNMIAPFTVSEKTMQEFLSIIENGTLMTKAKNAEALSIFVDLLNENDITVKDQDFAEAEGIWILSAFYINDLVADIANSNANLDKHVSFINSLAESPSELIRNVLEVDILVVVYEELGSNNVIMERLSPHARSLYDAFVKRQG